MTAILRTTDYEERIIGMVMDAEYDNKEKLIV